MGRKLTNTLRRPMPWLLALLIASVAVVSVSPNAVYADGSSDKAEAETKDQLVMRNGKVIDGRVIEEMDAAIRFEVHYPGLPPVVTTYSRSDILSIKKNVPVKGSASDDADSRDDEDSDDESDARKDYDDDAAKVYVFNFNGQLGYDVSYTPLSELIEDADRAFDDKDSSGMVKEEYRDKHIILIKLNADTNPRAGFDGLWILEKSGERLGLKDPLIEEMKAGRKVVFWVHHASNGAALFPFISPHIYFTSDARMQFTSDLEDFDIGDDVVDEKQISLRIGTAEGYLINGGYDFRILRPMVRSRYWLWLKISGGEAILYTKEDPPGADSDWELLTDNGEGDFEDDENALFGNDRLAITWQNAEWLGVSDGRADNIGELAYHLGIERNFVVLNDDDDFDVRADRILRDWRDGLAKANSSIDRIREDLQRIQVNGDYDERKAARGKRINLLKQAISWLRRYAEVLDPSGGQRSQLRQLIDQMKLEGQLDKPSGRNNDGGGGGRRNNPGRGIG